MRIHGLDSIRFVAALVVMLSHGYGFDFQTLFDGRVAPEQLLPRVLWLLAGNLYNGQAAVIVFFIVSGFCIHYPYASGKAFVDREFLLRRYLRIGIPIAVCLFLANKLFGIPYRSYVGLWSLICELVYYTLYPVLWRLRSRLGGWAGLYVASLISAFLVVLWIDEPLRSNIGTREDFPAFNFAVTALLGLPIWMMGCILAEHVVSRGSQDNFVSARIWFWRAAVFGASVICSILKFHGDKIIGFDIPYYVSFQFFTFLVVFWLLREIQRYQSLPVPRLLEWAGGWSYSLYIFHPLVSSTLDNPDVLRFFSPEFPFTALAALVASYFFYLAIEKPSHILARAASKRISGSLSLQNQN